MYKLNVTSNFSAAHKLVGYDGACRELHGHNWKVRICILCEKTDEIGLTIDFKIVKNNLNELLDEFDHHYLNEHPGFKDKNPTSENLAKYLFDELKKRITVDGCRIHEVEICESENSSMTYFE